MEVELARIEQQLARAWVMGDRAVLDRIIADDWMTTDLTGRLQTKREIMAMMFAATATPIAAMTIDDVDVRLLGNDVAVVTGRTVARGSGSSVEIVLRFTDVFVMREGRWQVVASHGTQIAAA